MVNSGEIWKTPKIRKLDPFGPRNLDFEEISETLKIPEIPIFSNFFIRFSSSVLAREFKNL